MEDVIIINSSNKVCHSNHTTVVPSIDGTWMYIVDADGEVIGGFNARGLKK
jgi:hypothetical protein